MMRESRSRAPTFLQIPKKILKSGFSLIESAIVLGVAGLVIGGIWVAAVSVQENMQINEMSKAILAGKQKMQSLYKGQDYASIASQDISNIAYNMGIFQTLRIDGVLYRTPWDAYVNHISISIASTGFTFWIPIPSKSICIKLAKSIATQGAIAEGIRLFIQNETYTTLWQGTPSSTADAYTKAQTYCLSSGKLGFSYPWQ